MSGFVQDGHCVPPYFRPPGTVLIDGCAHEGHVQTPGVRRHLQLWMCIFV